VRNVDPAVVDAARGMGMRGREVLFGVELPNALPLIIGGIRSAVLQVISTATIAAYVALGGLGRFIIDGLAVRDFPQMIAGSILVALLAIVAGLKQLAQDGPTSGAALTIAAGVGVGTLWVRRQRRLAEPMIDLALFRIRRFNAALVVNFLALFVMIGYFLFIGQYLQLVAGMSPLHAGLWSLPGALGFVVSSQLAPRFAERVRPANLVAAGLVAAAAGLFLLTTVQVGTGLAAIVVSSVVISLGMGPVFGLTTEMIVGSAPTEKAGAASGISETAAELGGALGIAVLGSIGAAIYRGGVAGGLPAGVPDEAAHAARDTLGGAVSAAAHLPEPTAAVLVDVAREAFVAGLQVTAAGAGVIAAAIAVVAAVALRDSGAPQQQEASEPEAEPACC
jgi:DHA2 family multidrug resistance protein-like MFS transporter